MDTVGQTTYAALFAQNPTYYSGRVESIRQLLSTSSVVTISGLPKIGKKRFGRYLEYLKAQGMPWLSNVVIVDNFVDLKPKEQKVITNDIFDKSGDQKYILIQPLSVYKNGYQQGITSSTMINQSYFFRPFGVVERDSYSAAVKFLYGKSLEKEKLELLKHLSGGHVGLLKWGILLDEKWHTAKELSELVEIQNTLVAIETQVTGMSLPVLKDVGFYNENLETAIPLYREYIGISVELDSPLNKALLEQFLNSRGVVVPFKQLEKTIAKFGEYSLWKTYKTLERFKNAVSAVYVVKNVKGKGYFIE